MKSQLFLFFFLLLSSAALAQNSSEALDYLNEITKEQKNISEQLMRYISVSAHSTNGRKIENKRRRLVDATDKARSHVQGVDEFEGDASLRDAVLTYYNLSYQSLTDDYKEIAAMKESANSNYEIMKALLAAEEQANVNLNKAQTEVESSTHKFAAEHEINLITEENPLSEMITKSNEVNQYYNDIFLPMFKVNLQNIQLKEMLQTGDIEKIEMARLQTAEYAEEARAELAKLSPFKGDNSLIEAAEKRVDYYLEEANVMALNSIEYAKVNAELEEKQAKIDKLKPKQRSKKIVDEFNVLVNQANSLVNKLNANAQRFNQTSQLELRQWQELVQRFKRTHIPKYGLYEENA